MEPYMKLNTKLNTKLKTIISAFMAISLATGGFAFAQNYGDRNEQQQRNDQGDRRDNQNWQRDHRDNQGRPHDNRDDRGRRQFSGEQRGEQRGDREDERGAGPEHRFYRGQRLPPEYRNRQYVVDDWRGHHLSAPPRGYHWVQAGGDYVLVANSSGVIFQLFLSN
jgi:Ni/Co efflux regulator RcnB